MKYAVALLIVLSVAGCATPEARKVVIPSDSGTPVEGRSVIEGYDFPLFLPRRHPADFVGVDGVPFDTPKSELSIPAGKHEIAIRFDSHHGGGGFPFSDPTWYKHCVTTLVSKPNHEYKLKYKWSMSLVKNYFYVDDVTSDAETTSFVCALKCKQFLELYGDSYAKEGSFVRRDCE